MASCLESIPISDTKSRIACTGTGVLVVDVVVVLVAGAALTWYSSHITSFRGRKSPGATTEYHLHTCHGTVVFLDDQELALNRRSNHRQHCSKSKVTCA